MSTIQPSLKSLPASEILIEAKRLASSEKQATAALVACLAEVDERKLFLVAGYNSMFDFCTRGLHMYEGSAYNRIEVARLAQRFPIIIDRLAAGDVTLTAVRLLGKHLTAENHLKLLDAVRHIGKEKLGILLAELDPKRDASPSVRKMPASRRRSEPVVATVASDVAVRVATSEAPPVADMLLADCGPQDAPAICEQATAAASPTRPPAAAVVPLSPGRYKVQFTVGAGTRTKLQHAQDLLRHTVPDGDIAKVFDRALTLLVEKLERTKFAATKRPRHKGRGVALCLLFAQYQACAPELRERYDL